MESNPARFVSLPKWGSTPVGKVICIGKNYARHAAEMGSAVPTTPMVFLKPSTALIPAGGTVRIPPGIGEVHHEVELVAVVGDFARNVSLDRALEVVASYAVGLDMTARRLQGEAKKSGGPWTVAKGFDTFAPIGQPVAAAGMNPGDLGIRLLINGRMVQEGHTSDMVFGIAQLIAYCSTVFTLEPGDLLYTGTPEGVGPVNPGDELTAEIDGLPSLHASVV
ncbi:MAG: acylpyruvate hydrolase [Rhodothermales bacterium]|jgi:acylpyruvate hydrolase